MKLADGLLEYVNGALDMEFTNRLLSEAEQIMALVQNNPVSPDERMLKQAKDFIVKIEVWKQMCIEKNIGHAITNSPEEVWGVLKNAIQGKTDLEKLESVMVLKGFGSTADLENNRPAKQASAVLRFLYPDSWGVVDWRSIAFLSILKKHNYDVELATSEARSKDANQFRNAYKMVNAKAVVAEQKKYRELALKENLTTSQAEMAIFGLSIEAWPFKKS